MKHFSITISIVLSLLFAHVEPILSQGKCIHCGMDIVAEKFLAKADLTTGAIVEFDAIECLVNYIKPKKSEEFSNLWVTDYSTGQIIEAREAFYLKSKGLPSPMGANLSAYKEIESATIKRDQLGGEVYDWDELRKKFTNSNYGSTSDHHHHGVNSYAPSGISGDHLHPKGGLMVSLKYMYMNMDGNRRGNEKIDDDTVFNSYMVAPQQMNMDMAMLGIMYAPADKLTLMLMQNLVWKNMDLTARMMMGNGMPMLTDFSTRSAFLGDMKLGALYGLYSGTKNALHLNSYFNIPIGDIENRDATPMMSDAKLPYAMQLGTGTFDITIGATFKGQVNRWSYGIQQLNTFRTGENSEGYRFGNIFELHSWLSYGISDPISTSIRLSGSTQGSIKGSDPDLNPMIVTTADPANYGGELIYTGFGVNTQVAKNKMLIGFEITTPLYRNYNGIQMDEKWGVNASLRYIAI